MPTPGDQCSKPQRENHTSYPCSHASSVHLYVNLLDYIPHKTAAVPLLRALRLSYRICRPGHQSILPAASCCPRRPPASPRILPNSRVQSGVRPGGSPVRRHLHSSNPVTGVESDTYDFNRHSVMQAFLRVGTNKYGTH